MKEMLILKSQKNEVLEHIKEYSLDPFNFEWGTAESEMTEGSRISKLEYKGTPFFYKFEFLKREHFAIFSPGNETSIERLYPENWTNQISYVDLWLSYLKRELDQPDLWVEIEKYNLPPGSTISEEVKNEPFNINQVEQILKAIEDIKEYLESLSVFEEKHKDFVNEKLTYLVNAAKRQGRIDWVHTCIGVIVTITAALGLAPEQSSKLWEFIKMAIIGVINFLPR